MEKQRTNRRNLTRRERAFKPFPLTGTGNRTLLLEQMEGYWSNPSRAPSSHHRKFDIVLTQMLPVLSFTRKPLTITLEIDAFMNWVLFMLVWTALSGVHVGFQQPSGKIIPSEAGPDIPRSVHLPAQEATFLQH